MSDFSYIIEKRVRKHIRLNDFFQKGDNIIVVGDLCNHLLKRILGRLPVKVTLKKTIPKSTGKRKAKIVIPYTADDLACCLLKDIFNNKKPKKTQYIRLLAPLTDDEAARYSKMKNILFKPSKKDEQIMRFIYSLQKDHPEALHTLAKKAIELEQL